MADVDALTSEWEQVLTGTLAYLRTQAASELDYAAVVRIERTAWRRSRQILADLELADEGEAPPATDELLRSAVAPSSRQAVTEQVLGASPVDDGPEGVADDANRELSEEISQEGPPLDAFAEPIDTVEEEFEEIEEMDTAPPGTKTPMGSIRQVEAEPPRPTDDAATFEGELDLDAIEEIPVTEAEEEPPLFEEEPAPRPAEGGEPLLPDFDFDEDDEQDETVVFSLGDSAGNTGEAVARLIEEHNAAEAAQAPDDDSFDLMPELDVEEADDDDELDIEPLSFDDDTDMEQEPAPMDLGGGAQASVSTRGRSPQGVTAGLYGNPNVPTIRDTPQPAPRAAAIKINASTGTGKMMGFEEEEEPLAIGSAEDYGEDLDDDVGDANFGGGFSLSIQQDDEYEEEWEDEDSEEEVQAAAPAPVPVYRGPDASQIAAVLGQAQEAAMRGDMQVGVDLFSDVLDADPDQVDAYVGRGRLYLDLGDYSRAMSDFMTAEDLSPKNPEPQVAIGDLYFARKDYRKAIEYFDGALDMDPNHAMAHCRRGISHYYRKNYSDALADLKTAEKMDPDIPNIGTYISMAQKKAKR